MDTTEDGVAQADPASIEVPASTDSVPTPSDLLPNSEPVTVVTRGSDLSLQTNPSGGAETQRQSLPSVSQSLPFIADTNSELSGQLAKKVPVQSKQPYTEELLFLEDSTASPPSLNIGQVEMKKIQTGSTTKDLNMESFNQSSTEQLNTEEDSSSVDIELQLCQNEIARKQSLEGQCLDAFEREEKEEVLRLLPKLSRPNAIRDDLGRTILHLAAWKGWDEICSLLMKKYQCEAEVTDIYGRSPLHFACSRNRISVIAVLLSTTSLRLTDKDKDGRTPFRSLRTNFSTMSQLASLMKDWSTEVPVSPLFKIFMTGNSAAGKSTLTGVMEELARPTPSQHGRVSGVKPLTAGVHTTQCLRKELELRKNKSIFGHVYDSKATGSVSLPTEIEIYDLAGHPEYYSSHAAILEVVTLESPAVFVIIVDLTKKEEQIAKELYSWSNFLQTQTSRIASHFIVLGSRKDKFFVLHSRLEKKCTFVKATAKDALEKQYFAGFVALDCRQLSSDNTERFLVLLKQSIEELTRGKFYGNMSFQSQLLYSFLRERVKAKVIGFDALHRQISLERILAPLSDSEVLASTLEILTDKGIILFFRNSSDLASSCVITDKQSLLLEINGVLFAPRYFKEYFQIASNTGIAPVSLLHERFPHYDSKILVALLTSLQFCHAVEQTLLKSMNTNLSPESATSDQLLYFPALNTVDRPGNISITKGHGWSIYCPDPHQCLTRHYLHQLMHNLAYTYCLPQQAPPKLEHSNEAVIRKLNRTCTVWKNGIHWTTADGTQAMVQVTEEYRSVSLLVSANKDSPRKSIELRSSLVETILSIHQKQCPSVDISEYLVSPSHLHRLSSVDLFQLTVFSMKDVARAVVHGEALVPAIGRKHKKRDEIKLESLLPSDPYLILRPVVVQLLFSKSWSNQPVPASVLEEVHHHYGDILIPVNPTYQSLQEQLNKLSVFAGRNPLELAGVTATDLPSPPPSSPPNTTDGSLPYTNIMHTLPCLPVHIEHYEVHSSMRDAVFQAPVGGFAAPGGGIGAASIRSNHTPPILQEASATDKSILGVTDADRPPPSYPPAASSPEKVLDTSYLFQVGLKLSGLKRWQELGLALGLDYIDLENIEEKKGDEVDKCRTAMLHLWLQTGRATKSSLITALNEMGEESFAANIHKWPIPITGTTIHTHKHLGNS